MMMMVRTCALDLHIHVSTLLQYVNRMENTLLLDNKCCFIHLRNWSDCPALCFINSTAFVILSALPGTCCRTTSPQCDAAAIINRVVNGVSMVMCSIDVPLNISLTPRKST